MLIDGTVREFPETWIYVDTPFYTGIILALCMENPVYDLIIGNIKGAREPSNPDPNWKSQGECETYCVQEGAETTEKVSVFDNSSVSCLTASSDQDSCDLLQAIHTRGQLQREKVGLKSLKVSDVVNHDMSVDEMKKAQQDDPSFGTLQKTCWCRY